MDNATKAAVPDKATIVLKARISFHRNAMFLKSLTDYE